MTGPTSARMIEFSGLSYAEAFRRAADWFAAHDGEVPVIRAIGHAILPATIREPETWFLLSVYYDD
ncbi:hypothetical protein [Nocardia paucivorans]|uniref:hypothetical protein n=1 Tax=Nocardia paucivorans TaxID=114259 RepID=UPI000318EAED|nr:hypothetical protein [Nocardia paucivorans]